MHGAVVHIRARAVAVLKPLDWLCVIVSAGVVAGIVMVVGDGLGREGWRQVDLTAHWLAAVSLYAAVGAAAGTAAALVLWLCVHAERAANKRSRALAASVAPVSAALGGAATFRHTAVWTFSGATVSSTAVARVGPYLFLVCIAAGLAAVALLVRASMRAVGRQRVAPLAAAAGLLLVGIGLMAIDLNVLVALYQRLHEMLELVTALCVLSALAIGAVAWATHHRSGRWTCRALGAGGLCWLVTFSASARLRADEDTALRHVWREPGYLGRMLMRKQLIEAYLRDPSGWRGARASRMARLLDRYDIGSTELAAHWVEPPIESPKRRHALAALRGGLGDANFIIFYVDTLRYDTSHDPAVMPELVRYAAQSLDFRRAYSFASDTVTALPVLLSGHYGNYAERGDLLHLAQAQKLPTALFIPRSARRFLAKPLPRFAFDHTIEVTDYGEDKKVWGYGADQPTAFRLVDKALEWIDGRSHDRFFAWLFNFDVHNWRELDADYIGTIEAKRKLAAPNAKIARYRAAAAGVDAAFAKLLAGLRARHLDRSTVVLVVSDHGEALGRRGHWVHAVYLWDALVHVPLVLHVPGLAPRVVDAPVGHVDVAPTIARHLDSDADLSAYHGCDLLRFTGAVDPGRCLPLLLESMRKNDVLRIGLVDRQPPFQKLVLPLESVQPSLHDIHAPDPDDADLARSQPLRTLELLSELVRSPVFPRDPGAETDVPAEPHGKEAARR